MSTYRDEVYEKRSCVDCSQPFTITMGEKQYLEERTDDFGHPLVLPKRCKSCRLKRRQMSAA